MPATVGLREWDPDRYGSLHHPGDAFSYDIFSQAARRLREGPAGGIDMLGGRSPRLVIATGGSQSAMRLGSYLNLAHQEDRVIDGFLLTVHWGLCPPPPDMNLVESFDLTPEFRFKASSQIRDDGEVPILVVNSESETMMVSIVRQPDSDTFRFWEMAGTAHAGGESAELMTAALVRDGVSDGLPVVEREEHDRLGLHRPRRVGAPHRVDRHWASTRVDSADHVRSCCGHRPRRDRQRARRGARARSGRAARRSHRHAERAVRCSIEWAVDTLDCSSASASSTRTPRRTRMPGTKPSTTSPTWASWSPHPAMGPGGAARIPPPVRC